MTDLFSKHKFLLSIFLILFLVFIFFHYKYSLGLFFDMPAMFLGEMAGNYDFSHFIFFDENRVRMFSNILVAIPFNIGILFIKNSFNTDAIKLFSSSYLIIHLFGLILNYIIAFRTKRFDIAAVCFSFYAFFSVQNLIWTCREVHIAILFYFAILSYFLSKTELKKADIIPISLILLYFFESFETTMVYGFLLFVFSVIYLRKNPEIINKKIKIYIGISGLLVSFYIPVRLLILSYYRGTGIAGGIAEWFMGSYLTLQGLFKTSSIITVFALGAFIFILFYKKQFSKKMYAFTMVYFSILLSILYFKTRYIVHLFTEINNYSFAFWFIFPVIITVFLFDLYQKEINKTFLSNLVIIASFTGIVGLLWQIHYTFEFNQYVLYLKKLMSQSQEILVTIPEEDKEKYNFLKFNTCYGIMHKSILLSDSYEVKKLIIPAEYDIKSTETVCDFRDKEHNYYNEDNQTLYLQDAPFELKNQYWDLSVIKAELEKEQSKKEPD